MKPLTKPLIVGLGNRWRGDDGVGPRVVEVIAALGRDDVDVVELDGETSRLVSAWAGRQHVVLVDAVRAGAPPGTIHQLIGPDRIPTVVGEASTHGGGVAAAVALSRALGNLPVRLVIVGVEPAAVDHDDQLSSAVACVLDDVVERVLEEVSGACV